MYALYVRYIICYKYYNVKIRNSQNFNHLLFIRNKGDFAPYITIQPLLLDFKHSKNTKRQEKVKTIILIRLITIRWKELPVPRKTGYINIFLIILNKFISI